MPAKKNRSRLDRFIEDSLIDFGVWFEQSKLLGKERDFVNLFALRFLASRIKPNAAITELSQIRIECGVAQPTDYSRKSATKDLVVWRNGLETAWDEDWKPINLPRAVMEFKTHRRPRRSTDFDNHDMDWLKAFTDEFPKSIGYLVIVNCVQDARSIQWARVVKGEIKKTNTRI